MTAEEAGRWISPDGNSTMVMFEYDIDRRRNTVPVDLDRLMEILDAAGFLCVVDPRRNESE